VLRELRVQNYALIEELDLVLPEGLVIFTGETGAGKSIIIGALALALGGRAQAEQIRAGTDEIVVEARFGGPFDPAVTDTLREAGISADEDLVLRRVVPAGGKSRAYVNGSAATLSTLEKIGRGLVDIHGQHQHQSLLHPETHLDLLDDFGRLRDERREMGEAFARWNSLSQERAAMLSGEQEKAQRLDFLSFQQREIERAGLRPDEDSELETQREILLNAGRLADAAREVDELVYSGESPAAAAVHQAARRMADLARVDPSLAQLEELLGDCQVQLEEAGREIQSYQRSLEDNPERLQEVEDRLGEINRLKRKYGDPVGAVLARLAEIQVEMERLQSGEQRLTEIDKELADLESEVARRAGELSGKREGALLQLEERVVAELGKLNLAGCSFRVSMTKREDASAGVSLDGVSCRVDESGADSVEFLLSANPGEPLKPLVKVASGGELSRIMLAIKTVLSDVDKVPTLIFDEVDIGIGGKTARMVGDRLKIVSRRRQVLCITHLPQIASLADSHYNIRKSAGKGRAAIAVSPLGGAERVEEIARMLGGRKVTSTTRRHAAELLGQMEGQ
jgi:DNA repair protein RecN (Recombination protein N)